jgi:multidrug transporter EmrE-like cation transporter
MNLNSFALILTGVLLNAVAQLMLKAGADRVGPIALDGPSLLGAARTLAVSLPIAGGLLCYVVSVAVWIVALSRVEVSVAYPMLSIGYIVNAFGAWFLFGEALSAARLTGILVIMLGIWILAGSARAA